MTEIFKNKLIAFNTIVSRLSDEDTNKICTALAHIAEGTMNDKQLLIYGGRCTGKSTFVNLAEMLSKFCVRDDVRIFHSYPFEKSVSPNQSDEYFPSLTNYKLVQRSFGAIHPEHIHPNIDKITCENQELKQFPFCLDEDESESLLDAKSWKYIGNFLSRKTHLRIIDKKNASMGNGAYAFMSWNAPALISVCDNNVANNFNPEYWNIIKLPDEPIEPNPYLSNELKRELPLIREYLKQFIQTDQV